MRKIILISIFVFSCGKDTYAQSTYFTRSGKIEFHAGTALEDIDAVNNEVTSVIDTQKGSIVFQVLIKSFHFRRALMEEHFNENYMESSSYPKATFNGQISNPERLNFKTDGSYSLPVAGDLMIHGVTKRISATATFTILNRKVSGKCSFIVKPEEFKIKTPSIVSDKISKEVAVQIECLYEPRN